MGLQIIPYKIVTLEVYNYALMLCGYSLT